MCGIAGIYNLKKQPIPTAGIKQMCDIIAHRGPDDAGDVLFNVKSGGSAGESRWQEFTETDFLRRTPDLHMGSFDAVADTRSSYNLALGHRRLSIIDLSPAGHQPMANRKKTIWITRYCR